jgi:TonB family protein
MRFSLLAVILSVLLAATGAGHQGPTAATDIVKVTVDENLRTIVNGIPVQRYPRLSGLFVHMPEPYYPPELRRRHVTGSGIFRMYIDESGRVTAVKIRKSTGHSELDTQATKGLTRWRTKPGQHREIDVPITFTMKGH